VGSVASSMAPFFAAKNVNAPAMRMAMGAIWADAPGNINIAETGVVPGGGNLNTAFTPTSVGSGSAPAVSLAPGQCVIQRPIGGTYVGTLPVASGNITIQTPLPASAQTRIDVVCASIVDGEADGGAPQQPLQLVLSTVTGTAAASPTVPAGYLPLYTITVNNAGALTFADVRTYTRGVGGMRFVGAGDIRPGSYPADVRIFAGGGVDAWLNPTGTWAWVPIVAPSVWTQTTAVLTVISGTSIGLGTGGSQIVRYKRTGNDLAVSYAFNWGSAPFSNPAGSVVTALPNGVVTPPGRDQWIPCHLWVNDPTSGVTLDFAGMALVNAGSNQLRPFFPRLAGSLLNAISIQPYLIATGAGPGVGCPAIPAGYPIGGALHINGTLELAS